MTKNIGFIGYGLRSRTMMKAFAGRLENYPDLRQRVERHVHPTRPLPFAKQHGLGAELHDGRGRVGIDVDRHSLRQVVAGTRSVAGLQVEDVRRPFERGLDGVRAGV